MVVLPAPLLPITVTKSPLVDMEAQAVHGRLLVDGALLENLAKPFQSYH